MIKCPGCGEENPPKFKLCGYCGTPLHAAAPPALPAKEIRKTVTLLFTDLKDSTALGERLDSEALHEVKERYFNAMADEIKRHGGKIEKYIGDAIMAVFGLPRAHEDDALRAVRAAVGMKEALQKVNAELGTRFGVQLANRTGVNTGEVVASDDPTADQKLATGDAVNVTARLEAAAPANEIYIGESTWRLVRDAVDAEEVEPLALKGKAQPVPAFRLVRAHGQDGNVRRHNAPVVGREAELAVLDGVWGMAIAQRRAHLVTVVGDAGVGKTRLVRELVGRLGERARVVFGRCLPYGDGITFWPLREMVVSAAGIGQHDTPDAARERLLACVADREVAERLASAAGLGTTQFPLHEINWAARKFMQTLAQEKPLLAIFDDIHWAEPAFLDLMENLLDTVEDAPVLMLGTARHDLIEDKPDWSQRARATRLLLQPLGAASVAQVVANLLGSTGLGDDLIGRIVQAAEGNPLYVEQMLSMLVDSGVLQQEEDGGWIVARPEAEIAVPPTIQALMAARLDKLDRSERAAAEPASVIGLEFAQPAVQSLAPPPVRDSIDRQLAALERKHFIRASRSGAAAQIYRFHHHLVREAVYNGLLKRARANFHVEFVRWADRVNAESDRGQEFEALLGYHLEQAYQYLGELGPHDEAGIEIGRDGARRLASAGRRAFARGDMHAAANLFRRAIALLAAQDPQRLTLLPELGETLLEIGAFADAGIVLDEAVVAAERESDERLKASAQLLRMRVRLYSGEPGERSGEILRLTDDAIPLLEQHKAYGDLARAWRLVAFVHGVAGRYGKSTEAVVESIRHARLAGDSRLVARGATGLASSSLLGPTPVDKAIGECEQVLAEGLTDRQAESTILCTLAQLRAMNGEFERARALYRRGRELLRTLGQGVLAASTGLNIAQIEYLAGDFATAERELRAAHDFLAQAHEGYLLPTMAALLSRLACDQGREEEALRLAEEAEKSAADDDVDTQVLWRLAKAPLLARRGRIDEGSVLARAALDLALQTDAPVLQADALSALADVLSVAGERADASSAVERALALYDEKGDRISRKRLETWYQALACAAQRSGQHAEHDGNPDERQLT